MRVIRVPLSFEIKQEWPLRTSVLRQLLWSLSFRLFENMVICNARNNPCPLSHNARFFFLKNYRSFFRDLSIIILIYTVFLSIVLPF